MSARARRNQRPRREQQYYHKERNGKAQMDGHGLSRYVVSGFCCVSGRTIPAGAPVIYLPARPPKRNPGLVHPGECHRIALCNQADHQRRMNEEPAGGTVPPAVAAPPPPLSFEEKP